MDNLSKMARAFRSLKWFEVAMCLAMVGISVYYAILPQPDTPRWLAAVNFVSGLCGVVCVFFVAKANRMNFPFAVANTVSFMVFLGYFGIWATFWLEALVYFPMNIISWAKWHEHRDEEDELLAKSRKLTARQHLGVCLLIASFTVVVYLALSAVAGDTWMRFAVKFGWDPAILKWLDSAVFSIGIVAVVLEALRYSEQYVWWIVTDVIAVLQYALKGDPVYTAKKLIYLVQAFVGLHNWNALARKNAGNE